MLWPLAVYVAIVIALAVMLLGLSALLGERHRERATGWIGYIEGFVFIGVLLAALAYLWRIGGLDFVEPHRSVS